MKCSNRKLNLHCRTFFCAGGCRRQYILAATCNCPERGCTHTCCLQTTNTPPLLFPAKTWIVAACGNLRQLALCAAQDVMDLVVCALQVACAANAGEVCAPPSVAADTHKHKQMQRADNTSEKAAAKRNCRSGYKHAKPACLQAFCTYTG